MAKKRGRKNAYLSTIQPRLGEIKEWIEKEGLLNKEICKRLNISHNTFYKYVNEYSELYDVVYNTDRKALVDDLEITALKVAKGYFVTEEKTVLALDKDNNPTKKTKEIYKKYQSPNARMIEFLLTNWAKDKYKRDPAQMDYKELELEFKKQLAETNWNWGADDEKNELNDFIPKEEK